MAKERKHRGGRARNRPLAGPRRLRRLLSKGELRPLGHTTSGGAGRESGHQRLRCVTLFLTPSDLLSYEASDIRSSIAGFKIGALEVKKRLKRLDLGPSGGRA